MGPHKISVINSRLTCILGFLLPFCSSFGQQLSFLGNTSLYATGLGQEPTLGSYIEPNQSLTVTTQTYPISTGQSVSLIYSTDHFATSHTISFNYDTTVGNNTQWKAQIGPLPAGSDVLFYLQATTTNGITLYDNNSSQNFGFISRFEPTAPQGAILQWFATDYATILKRLPEVAKIGYGAIYLPPPQKSGGGGFSVGYNPFDRFDLGDRLQSGSIATQYGTTEQLLQVIQLAKRLGLKVYCDTVLNHNDNRGSTNIANYPNLIPEDFHIFSTANPNNNQIDFNNAPSFQFALLNNDLVGLADIAHEDGNLSETGPFNLPSFASFNAYGKPTFVREPLDPQLYPNGTPVTEDVRQYLKRWCSWLVSLGFDGFRLDAVREMDPAFFLNANTQGGFNVNNGNLLPLLYSENPNLYIFGEDDNTSNYEQREYLKTGMDLLDFPLFNNIGSIFNSNGFGDLGSALGNGFGIDAATGAQFQNGGLAASAGVSFVQSHDYGPPTSNNLAYAFTLTRPGATIVYFDGNNLDPNNYNQFPKPGRADSLGYSDSIVTNLVDARARYMRGNIVDRYTSTNLFVYEHQESGNGLSIVGLNNRGDQTPLSANIQTAFPPNTVLTDLSGQEQNITVDSNGQILLTVPPNSRPNNSNNAQGYVVYVPVAPTLTSPIVVRDLNYSRVVEPTSISTPTGPHGVGGSYQEYIVNGNLLSVQIPTDIGASCWMKVDNGAMLPGKVLNSNSLDGLTDGYFQISGRGGTFSDRNLNLVNLSDGLHLLRVRVFENTGNRPGIFQDFCLFVQIDRSPLAGINGILNKYGNPVTTQTVIPTSQSNRLDEMFLGNDDKYLYIGLAGQVLTNTSYLNGVVTFLDLNPGSGQGYTNFASIKDDYGPAGRLMSNSNVIAPPGFTADAALVSFGELGLNSTPNGSGNGDVTLPASFGAQVGLFRIDPSTPTVETGLLSKVAWLPRSSPFGNPTGLEAAVPLSSLFGGHVGVGQKIGILSYITTSGETGSTLNAYDPLRSSLGGRPQPHGYVLNQILPVQPGITSDPGTGQVQLQNFVTYSLNFARTNPQISATGTPVIATGQAGTYTNTVTIKNIGSQTIHAPFYLIVHLGTSAITLNMSSGQDLQDSNSAYQKLKISSLQANQTFRFVLTYQNPSGVTVNPTYEVRTGTGIP